MSTNYYMSINECKACGRKDEIHLGKVTNREFISNYNIFTLKQFIDLSNVMVDEYGTIIGKDEMLAIISACHKITIVDYENFC